MPSLSQLLLGGINEIIGADDLTEIFKKKGIDYSARQVEFSELSHQIFGAILEKYGRRGGEGIAFRSGSVFGKKLRHMCGKEMGLESDEYRFMSTKNKILFGLEKLGEKLNREMGIEIEVKKSSDFWIVSIAPGGSKNFTGICCQFVIGMIYDYLTWAGSGKVYPIEEMEPFEATRSRCLVRINKQALEA